MIRLRKMLGMKSKLEPLIVDPNAPPYVPEPYDPSTRIIDDAEAEEIATRYGLNDLDLVRLIDATDGGGLRHGAIIYSEPPWARVAYILARRDERNGIAPKPFVWHVPETPPQADSTQAPQPQPGAQA